MTTTDRTYKQQNPVADRPLYSADVLGYLRDAVAEVGEDYVDPNAAQGEACQNVYWTADGEVCGRCIAAEVLSRHGVPDDLLKRTGLSIGSMIRFIDQQATPLAVMMLMVAQGVQDSGATWQAAHLAAHHVRIGNDALLLRQQLVDDVIDS